MKTISSFFQTDPVRIYKTAMIWPPLLMYKIILSEKFVFIRATYKSFHSLRCLGNRGNSHIMARFEFKIKNLNDIHLIARDVN